jgi:hypothetical protein
MQRNFTVHRFISHNAKKQTGFIARLPIISVLFTLSHARCPITSEHKEKANARDQMRYLANFLAL